jgi:hypothetical protein
MTPAGITAVRASLGHRIGLGRPLTKAELGRALYYGGRDPGRYVAQWEAGKRPVPELCRDVLEAMDCGYFLTLPMYKIEPE